MDYPKFSRSFLVQFLVNHHQFRWQPVATAGNQATFGTQEGPNLEMKTKKLVTQCQLQVTPRPSRSCCWIFAWPFWTNLRWFAWKPSIHNTSWSYRCINQAHFLSGGRFLCKDGWLLFASWTTYQQLGRFAIPCSSHSCFRGRMLGHPSKMLESHSHSWYDQPWLISIVM